MVTKAIIYTDAQGDEHTVHLPATWHICTDCRGTGGSSAYLGAFTREQMHEEGPEFMEDYMAGHYDRPCEHCNGTGKVLEVDRERVQARGVDEELAALAAMDEQVQDAAEDRAIMRMEQRLMGDYS